MPIAAAAWYAHNVLQRRGLAAARDDSTLPESHAVLDALSYTTFASLAGGAQLVVHSKGFTTALTIMLQGDASPMRSWLLYVEALVFVACGSLWGVRLTTCLSYFDPLLILPLMVGLYILFGGIAGGIFFGEFETLHEGPGGVARWPLYILGMGSVLCGLALIASASLNISAMNVAPAPTADEPAEPPDEPPAGKRVLLRADTEPSPTKLVKPRSVMLLSVQVRQLEQRRQFLDRLAHPSPSAAALPTPLSSMRARVDLAKLAKQTSHQFELMSVPASPHEGGTPGAPPPAPTIIAKASRGANEAKPSRWPLADGAGEEAADRVSDLSASAPVLRSPRP